MNQFNKVPLPVIGGVAALVVIGIIVVAIALSQDTDETGNGIVRQTPTSISAGLQRPPSAVATADLTIPTVQASNLNSLPSDARILIPRFGVDAPMTYRVVGPDGIMPSADGPDDIAYYDFSAWPNKGGSPEAGNVVLAGHVDSGRMPCNNGTVPPPCRAVLWDLNNLTLGDEIHLVLDGVLYKYAVISNEPIHAVNGPWDQIVSSTARPMLTIMTAGGDLNRETGEYDQRQVVQAERIQE